MHISMHMCGQIHQSGSPRHPGRTGQEVYTANRIHRRQRTAGYTIHAKDTSRFRCHPKPFWPAWTHSACQRTRRLRERTDEKGMICLESTPEPSDNGILNAGKEYGTRANRMRLLEHAVSGDVSPGMIPAGLCGNGFSEIPSMIVDIRKILRDRVKGRDA